MPKDIIQRAKELYYQANTNPQMIKTLQEEYGINSDQAGSALQDMRDHIEAIDDAQKWRYWNLFGGLFLAILAIPAMLLDRFIAAAVLGSGGVKFMIKGWELIHLLKKEKAENKPIEGVLDANL
jgi:hypothetical protein